VTGPSPLDELRALPPTLARVVLAQVAAERGPAAVAALRWQVEAHLRPAQRLVGLDELCADGQPWRVLVISGEYGSGKTQLATWQTLRAIVDWRVERPRIVAANDDTIRDDLVKPDAPSGLLAWLPPWIPREYLPSAQGRGGRLTVDGVEVSMVSAKAGANAIGSACGWCLFDDFAKCVQLNGQASAEEALAAAFKSLRANPGRMVLPTTPEGAEMVLSLSRGEGMRGVLVLDLGRTEDNRALPPAALDFARGLRKLNLWTKAGRGAFAEVEWARWRVDRAPRLSRFCVAIDPTKTGRGCDAGVVGLGLGVDGVVYGLADRSRPMGPAEWPAEAWQLFDELAEQHPEVIAHEDRYCLAEDNTGRRDVEQHLRAQEQIRRAKRGLPAVSATRIETVTARPHDDKAARAGPVVELARAGGVRMVRGLGVLEAQLSALGLAGQNGAADAFVHGSVSLARLGKQGAAAPAATAGTAEANERMRLDHAAPADLLW
jgi:hypothetical protein